MDTENRKPAADEQANEQANDQADEQADEQASDSATAPQSASAPGDAAAAQDSGPDDDASENGASENSAAEDSVSGWTAAAQAAATEFDVPAESPEETDVDTIVRLDAEKADLTDRLLRVVAEMDNLRKRTEREVADARKFSLAGFAGDMLSVSDNLKRALGAVPPEARESGDEALDALLAGVDMTGREMERMLEKNGVTRIAALGEQFDPHCHQAMFEVPDESIPNRTVVEVVQDGYRIGERILRAAMVGVAKGGPKATKPETAIDDAGTDLPEPPEAA